MLSLYAIMRERRLRRILTEFPLYDPPHRVEERLLSKNAARDNFEYFMSTRKERVSNLIKWLIDNFGVHVTMDMAGVRALCRWGNRFAGLLPVGIPSDLSMSAPFFTYNPIWRQKYAGYNVIFDMGTAYGEALIAQVPSLYWDFCPTTNPISGEERAYEREALSGYRRPQLTSRSIASTNISVHEEIWNFCFDMRADIIDKNGNWRLKSNLSAIDRRAVMNSMVRTYQNIIVDHSAAAVPHTDVADDR